MVASGWCTRRRFLALLPGTLLVAAAAARAVRTGPHPTPRPGIDGSRVLTRDRLENAAAAPVFDMVRKVPQVVDGIRCQCGCADAPGYYSLLSCYEQGGMAQHCDICQGEARLVYRLHGEGWSLDGIRAAIDAAFAG